ncbi:MAG: prolipoprotein diacylglyceryl transferase [bacterium]|nr:prolipoprotein diacylglyceryl transferase [bacterium]
MDPVFLQLGDSFQLRYHGLFWALGILVGYLIARRDLKWIEAEINEDDLFNLIIFTFIGGIIGARAFYVFIHWEFYSSSRVPWYEFAAIWQGGLSIFGGLVAGPITLWLVCQAQGHPFGKLADLFAPSFLMAQVFGKLGNFMNGDTHGLPTELPWGVVFHYGPAAREFPGMALHPVMLYEALLNLIAFGLLFSIRKMGFRPGMVAAVYMILFGSIRFVEAFFRADEAVIMDVKLAFPLSALLALSGLVLILFLGLHEEEQVQRKRETQYLPKRQWKL